MKDLETKKKVLDEIIELMDEKEGENLKKKSPKFMAAKVEIQKPAEEKPAELMSGEESEEGEKEEMTPEMIQKLLEMYKDLQ